MARGEVNVASNGQGLARDGVNVASKGQGLARDGACIASAPKGCPSSVLDRCFDAMRVAEGGPPRVEGGLDVGLLGTCQSRAVMQSSQRDNVCPPRVKEALK
jgi:hypothetical protein